MLEDVSHQFGKFDDIAIELVSNGLLVADEKDDLLNTTILTDVILIALVASAAMVLVLAILLVFNGLLVGDEKEELFNTILTDTMLIALVATAAMVLAIHWSLLPFTWLPILIWVLSNCDDYYINNILYFPAEGMLYGTCYKPKNSEWNQIQRKWLFKTI